VFLFALCVSRPGAVPIRHMALVTAKVTFRLSLARISGNFKNRA
jgi:hypothetical protein